MVEMNNGLSIKVILKGYCIKGWCFLIIQLYRKEGYDIEEPEILETTTELDLN